MILRLRPLLLLPLGLLAAAAARGAEAGEAPLPPELAALLHPPKWLAGAVADAAIGYKDNLLLSHAAQERSLFGRYGLELFLMRVPRGRVDYSLMVNAQDTRFFTGVAVDHESSAFAQGRWRYRVDDRFDFTLNALGFFFDEVRDVSDTDIQRLVAEIELEGVTAGPTIRWSPRKWGWVEVQAVGRRELYRDGVYDAKIGEGAARIGWVPRSRIELSVGVMERRRRYDRRQQYDFGGLPIDDTLLTITERETEGAITLAWGAEKRLKTTLRASELEFADNGTGYFDFRQRRIAHVLSWKGAKWEVDFEVAAQRHDYRIQVVGFGLEPPPRIAEEYIVDLRAERTLSERWSAYVGYRWERSRSNDPLASYRVNEGLLGARWSWDK